MTTGEPCVEDPGDHRPTKGRELPSDSAEAHELVRTEILRYVEELNRQASQARKGAYRYKALNAIVSWGSIVLAGVAAVSAAVGDDVIALTVASAAGAAIAAAVQKTVDPGAKAREVRDESIAWERLATKFRHVALFELPELPASQARHRLEVLLDERWDLDKQYIGARPRFVRAKEREVPADVGKRPEVAS